MTRRRPEPSRLGGGTYPTTPSGSFVAEHVRGTRFHEVTWFARIGSTNAFLGDLAARGAPDGVVVGADEQTAGRGRLDRRWEARPQSSLLVSALVRPRLEPAARTLVILAAAVAGSEAITRLTGLDVGLKWPNDVVVDGRKVGGLLAEAHGDAVVVGFGCNVAWGAMPKELPDATSIDLVSDAPPPTIDDLCVAWLVQFDERLRQLESAGGAELLVDATRVMTTLGHDVTIELAAGDLAGRADRLGPAGELVVVDGAGREHVVAVGDVVHLRAS